MNRYGLCIRWDFTYWLFCLNISNTKATEECILLGLKSFFILEKKLLAQRNRGTNFRMLS